MFKHFTQKSFDEKYTEKAILKAIVSEDKSGFEDFSFFTIKTPTCDRDILNKYNEIINKNRDPSKFFLRISCTSTPNWLGIMLLPSLEKPEPRIDFKDLKNLMDPWIPGSPYL